MQIPVPLSRKDILLLTEGLERLESFEHEGGEAAKLAEYLGRQLELLRDLEAPKPYRPAYQRPTPQEECPTYRQNMKDAGRGHLLP